MCRHSAQGPRVREGAEYVVDECTNPNESEVSLATECFEYAVVNPGEDRPTSANGHRLLEHVSIWAPLMLGARHESGSSAYDRIQPIHRARRIAILTARSCAPSCSPLYGLGMSLLLAPDIHLGDIRIRCLIGDANWLLLNWQLAKRRRKLALGRPSAPLH